MLEKKMKLLLLLLSWWKKKKTQKNTNNYTSKQADSCISFSVEIYAVREISASYFHVMFQKDVSIEF